MAATVGPSSVVQGSFNEGNGLFREVAGIQYACMALFAISSSTIKEINRWDKSDIDIALINGDALYKTFRRQTKICQAILIWVKKRYIHIQHFIEIWTEIRI